jgi:hypothetical protein
MSFWFFNVVPKYLKHVRKFSVHYLELVSIQLSRVLLFHDVVSDHGLYSVELHVVGWLWMMKGNRCMRRKCLSVCLCERFIPTFDRTIGGKTRKSGTLRMEVRRAVCCVNMIKPIDIRTELLNSYQNVKYIIVWECIQKFQDWVHNEIYAYLCYYSLRSSTKDYGVKTH